jgi:hypothetical protein
MVWQHLKVEKKQKYQEITKRNLCCSLSSKYPFVTPKSTFIKRKTVSKVVANATAVNIETSNFTPGVYFVTVSSISGTQKLVIE